MASQRTCMVCRPVCTATTRILVGSSKLLCFRFYKTLCFPTYTTFTLPYNFSHQNVCVFNSLTEVLRSHLKNFAMLTGSEVLCSLIPSQRRGVGWGIFSVQDLCDLFSLRNFEDFIIHLFRNPVLRPGFPLFFQHGQPQGIRRGRCCVLLWLGMILYKVAFIFRRSSSHFVFPSFGDGGLNTRYYAVDVRAGSRGLGPDYARLIRA